MFLTLAFNLLWNNLKDERAAHVAGSDGPCEPPRKTGQSSFQRDMRENSSSQETKEQNESPAAPSRSPDLPKMRDGACDPSPDLLLHSLRFSLSIRLLDLSLLVGAPWSASLSSASGVSSRWPCRRRGPTSRRRCRGAAPAVRRSSPAACAKAGVSGRVGAEVDGRFSYLLVSLRGSASSSAAAPSVSGRRPTAASSSSEALAKGSRSFRACVVV